MTTYNKIMNPVKSDVQKTRLKNETIAATKKVKTGKGNWKLWKHEITESRTKEHQDRKKNNIELGERPTRAPQPRQHYTKNRK